MPKHRMTELAGMHHACAHANPKSGRFRRLFPDLAPLYLPPKSCIGLASAVAQWKREHRLT